ncbi:TolC family protein [Candidatus Sumerlaeota bacterium]
MAKQQLSLGRLVALLCLIASCALLHGCVRFGEFAKRRADRAAYAIIEEAQLRALGQAGEISIDEECDELTSGVLAAAGRLDWQSDSFTSPSHLISLSDALALAVRNNRDYRTRKESLFNQALGLTETRRNHSYTYSASGNLSHTRVESGHDTLAGQQVERFGSRGLAAGINKLFASGARFSTNFSHSYLRNFTTNTEGASNGLAVSVVQPLLRGAGSLVAREPLRQAERSMVYAVRDFRRYQQQFVIDASSTYYQLLSAQDQVRNARRNLDVATGDWAKVRRLSEGGKRTAIEVDQARQRVLEAEASWINAQSSYLSRLDSLKRFLGLPIELDIGPDAAELERIFERGLLRPDMELTEALEAARANRLDLLTTRERVADSERQLQIALRDFLPGLSFSYDFSTSRESEKDRFNTNFRDHTQTRALSLELPLDWTPRRNNYRRALIALTQANRSLELAEEDLTIEVREAWRELERVRRNYEVQLESARLAEKRVRRASLMLESGRAQTRDLLDAQDDLLAGRNAVTSALVDHTLQRLRFWQSIERLEIDAEGMWHE